MEKPKEEIEQKETNESTEVKKPEDEEIVEPEEKKPAKKKKKRKRKRKKKKPKKIIFEISGDSKQTGYKSLLAYEPTDQDYKNFETEQDNSIIRNLGKRY
jgi:hypothetical protein